MAVNQSGIAIVIRAFLPMGKTLDDQLNALTLVKKAHESGDYSGVLAVAQIEDVKADKKTRRIDDPVKPEPETEQESAGEPSGENTVSTDADPDDEAPKFLKNKKPPKT